MFMFIKQSKHTPYEELCLICVDFQLLTVVIHLEFGKIKGLKKIGLNPTLIFCIFIFQNLFMVDAILVLA